MIRTATIVVLAAASVGVAALWTDSHRPREHHTRWAGRSVDFGVGDRMFGYQTDPGVLIVLIHELLTPGSKVPEWSVGLADFAVGSLELPRGCCRSTTPCPKQRLRIASIPLWFVLLCLSWYPTLALIRSPFRRWRRRRGGCCLNCGYDLRGNLTGVCPECGCAVSS